MNFSRRLKPLQRGNEDASMSVGLLSQPIATFPRIVIAAADFADVSRKVRRVMIFCSIYYLIRFVLLVRLGLKPFPILRFQQLIACAIDTCVRSVWMLLYNFFYWRWLIKYHLRKELGFCNLSALLFCDQTAPGFP